MPPRGQGPVLLEGWAEPPRLAEGRQMVGASDPRLDPWYLAPPPACCDGIKAFPSPLVGVVGVDEPGVYPGLRLARADVTDSPVEEPGATTRPVGRIVRDYVFPLPDHADGRFEVATATLGEAPGDVAPKMRRSYPESS
jgi:hypothetical protein